LTILPHPTPPKLYVNLTSYQDDKKSNSFHINAPNNTKFLHSCVKIHYISSNSRMSTIISLLNVCLIN